MQKTLVVCIAFIVIGCRPAPIAAPSARAAPPAPVAADASIKLSKVDEAAKTVTYTWSVKDIPVNSVSFGSVDLHTISSSKTDKISLALVVQPSGDQVLATVTLGATAADLGETTASGATTVGTDKVKDVAKLVTPSVDLASVKDGAVLAKGAGAFPSLAIHLRS